MGYIIVDIYDLKNIRNFNVSKMIGISAHISKCSVGEP